MIGFFSLRRIVPVMALAMLALAWPASADDKAVKCKPFQASGTFTSGSSRGAFFEGTISGAAKPGGAFTGTVRTKGPDNNSREAGTVVFDFGGGDTLITEVDLERDPETGLLVGTFVITGGTGEFEGATGGGDQIVNTEDGTFELDGTLCT